VEERGTLLQVAVNNMLGPFVRHLLEYGADPSAVCKDNKKTPWQIAVGVMGEEQFGREDDMGEMLELLKEFAPIPDSVNFEALSKLMNFVGIHWRKELQKQLFQKLLPSVSLELVNTCYVDASGSLEMAVFNNEKQEFVRSSMVTACIYFTL